MEDPRLADHAVGLELELGELVEQRERARVQQRPAEEHRLQHEIDGLQLELAKTADEFASSAQPVAVHARHAGRVA